MNDSAEIDETQCPHSTPAANKAGPSHHSTTLTRHF